MVRIFIFLGGVLLVCLLTCHSPNSVAKRTDAVNVEQLKKIVETFDQDPMMQQGFVALCVKSAKTGELIFAHQARKSLQVASCMKTVTTMAGLALLGKDYTFKTYVEYDGALQKGGLQGNVYVRGGGDPTLGSKAIAGQDWEAIVQQWAGKVKAAGISRIDGDLIIDEEYFDENLIPYGWLWGDVGNYYGAPAFSLNLMDNTYEVHFQPGSNAEDPVSIQKIVPELLSLPFYNKVRTAAAGTGDQSNIYGAPYTTQRFADGTLPAGGVFIVKGSIPDPAFLCGQYLAAALSDAGVSLKGKVKTTRQMKEQKQKINTSRKLIHTHVSPSLTDISKWINLFSVNLYAESIFKTLGLKSAKMSNNEAGAKALKDFWKSKGINTEGLQIYDGSGLSSLNLISAEQLTDMLCYTAKQPHFQAFYQSLPIAGVSGTMTGIAGRGRALNNLRAKTGGMSGVSAYCGYFKAGNGELVAFTLIANRFVGQYNPLLAQMEQVMVTMTE